MTKQNNLISSQSLSNKDWISYFILCEDEINWNESSEQLLERTTYLFRNTSFLIANFNFEDLNSSLWRLLNESGFLSGIFQESINIDKRILFIESIQTLMEELFLPHCQPILSSILREYPDNYCPLNSICYMWWDIFPSWGDKNSSANSVEIKAFLKIMEDCLYLQNIALIESSLHGLGHWHLNYPSAVEAIINQFLNKTKNYLDTELKIYAESACRGCVN